MSSKKKLRQQRREKRAAERRTRGMNPATKFILATIALVVILGIVASLRGGPGGEAPWPGAVWSEAHGHWH